MATTTTLKPAKIKELRVALEARREQVQSELDRLDEEMRSLGADQESERGALGNHLAEDGSNVTEQSRILAVSGDLRDILAQVDDALARIEQGSYGLCRRCGKPINPERLEAFPYVAYDIECQQILEREQSLRGAR
jgi:DnaK suppressor protein